MKVVYSRRAIADLDKIASYYSTRASPAIAQSIARRFIDVIERVRRVHDNPYIFENFEWLAMYSTWWKDTPRDPRDRNYDPDQFRGVTFRV